MESGAEAAVLGMQMGWMLGRLPPLVLLRDFDHLIDAGLERIEVGKSLDFLADANDNLKFLQLEPQLFQNRHFVRRVIVPDD